MDNRLSDQISHPPSSHTQSIHPPSALYRVPCDRPSGSFHPSHPYVLHHRHPSMQFDAPDSCISSLFPHGIDPAVDFRTFYPYIPNEVKHRKRTSRAQLKVLEDVFRHDTKPNAQLRKKLAKQLEMTARGVQVWFQNRRAKEKTQAKKALTASKTMPILDLSKETQSTQLIASTPDSPHPSNPDDPHVESPESEDNAQDENTPESTIEGPQAPLPTHFRPNSASALWQIPSTEALGRSGQAAQSRGPDTHNFPLHSLRRGSLPLISVTADNAIRGPQLDHVDPLARRRSVDTSLHRLASHPYAQLALAKNGALYGPSISRYPSQLRLSGQPGNMHDNQPMHNRPSLVHRASFPHELPSLNPRQRASFDSRGYQISNASSSSLLTGHHGFYSIPARTICSPIPGPLPCPDFSFGAPSQTPPTSSPSPTGAHCHSPIGGPCDSPELLSTIPAYALARQDDPDTEDDGTSASYSALSRFGSIASSTGSESSGTSAYYSDVSSTGVGHDMRRGSCTSGQILDLLSGLHVNGQPEQGTSAYSSLEELNAGSCDRDIQGVDTTYPSPSSTLSPCHDQNHPALPISRASELAYALQHNQEQPVEGGHEPRHHYRDPSDSPVANAQGSSQNEAPYAYRHSYSGSASSSSSSSLPAMEFAERFGYDGDLNVYSSTGHYTSYSSPNERQYAGEANFSPMEGQDLHHATDFTQCGSSSDVYSTYPANVQTAALEPFVQYS